MAEKRVKLSTEEKAARELEKKLAAVKAALPVVTHPKFNLLDEPWIKVLQVKPDGTLGVRSLSLCEVFENAHEVKGLAGELPGQDLAVLRLLLSVMHIVYTRTPEYKKARYDVDYEAAVAIWKSIHDVGAFDSVRLTDYLKQYHDRFYLVHPERPFYQIAGLLSDRDSMRNEYGVRKFIGDISESNNKGSLFSYRNGITEVPFDEAARWLLHLNAFDDAGNKAVYDYAKGISSGVGWLGTLGAVYLKGETLFETLMLNFVLYNEGQSNAFWVDGEAPWELAVPRSMERVELPSTPNSQIELLTLQSRRVWLFPTDTGIRGYNELGGDFIPKCDVTAEQMTLLKFSKATESSFAYYMPAKHTSAAQFWRGFSSLVTQADKTLTPGVIRWLSELDTADVDLKKVTTCAVRYEYGEMNSSIAAIWDDSFSINTGLFAKSANAVAWQAQIVKSVAVITKMVDTLGTLAMDIACAGGYRTDGKTYNQNYSKKAPYVDNAYATLDLHFRSWLASIDPDVSDIETVYADLVLLAYAIVYELGEELFHQAGDRAFAGRVLKTDETNSIKVLNSLQAFTKFKAILNSVVTKGGVTR